MLYFFCQLKIENKVSTAQKSNKNVCIQIKKYKHKQIEKNEITKTMCRRLVKQEKNATV